MKIIIIIFCTVLVNLCGYGQRVDPLTGKAVINIPLGGISAQDLSASVSLSHTGGALKVDEGAGNAGMGWNVNLGGSIFREVRGLPDEYNNNGRSGWLINGNGQAIQNLGNSTDAQFINGLGNVKDTEPDIYYFNAPGISGKFLYGADGQLKLIPYQDLKITMGSTIEIRTNTGIVYSFSSGAGTTRKAVQFKEDRPVTFFSRLFNYYKTPVTFTNAWYLSSIVSKATGASMTFDYQQGHETISSELVTVIQPNLPTQATTTVDTLYSIQDTSTPRQLTHVNLKNYSINLTWANGLVDGVKLLESETGEGKEFKFYYKTVYYSGTRNTFLDVGKPFLLHVREVNTTTCSAFPSYIFSYSGIDTTALGTNTQFGSAPVDWKRNWGQDFFGYFNGRTESKNIPSVFYYPSETNSRKLRVTPIVTLTASQQLNGVVNNTQQMGVNLDWSNFGALYKIDYPTGGATFINYEPNRYWDGATGEEQLGPGVRVESISTSGGEAAFNKNNWKANRNQFHVLTKSYKYTQAGGVSSGVLLYPPSFAFTNGTQVYRTQTNQSPSSQLFYTQVKEEIEGQGYRLYEYDVPSVYVDVSATESQLTFDGTPSVSIGSYTFPFAPLEDLDFKRGFLTKTSEYSQAGVLTQEKRFNYTQPQANTFVKALRYEYLKDGSQNDQLYYSIYKVPINQSRMVLTETTKMVSDINAADTTKATIEYAYNAKNMVTQTIKTNDDNSVTTTTIKYAMDYAITAPKAGDLQADAIFKLNASDRYGEAIETIQKFTPPNATQVVAGAKLYLFKSYNGNVWPYQVKSFPQTAAIVPSSIVAGTTQAFKSDTNYILESTTDYANGLPANQIGISLVPNGVHYAEGIATPMTFFANCKAENAVYDGFEFTMSRGLQSTGPNAPIYQTGRTGKKAVLLNKDSPFASSTVTPILKNGNMYRVSCWAYSSETGSLVVKAKNGATEQASLTLNYTTPNTWAYLEGNMNTAAVASSFNIALSTVSLVGIALDDFVAMPLAARVSYSTIKPFVGATSQTDDRGNSTVANYDPMGRKTTTLDKQRNLVELQEYGLQRQGAITLSAGFSSTTSKYTQGQQVLFSATQQCLPQVSYDWVFYENGVETYAHGKDVYKTFATFGDIKVQLTVSSPGYASAATIEDLCVSPSASFNLNLTVNFIDEDIAACPTCIATQNKLCEPTISNVRIFRPQVRGGGTTGWIVSYNYIVKDANGNIIDSYYNQWIQIQGDGSLKCISPAFTYEVTCIAQLEKINNTPYSACNNGLILGSTVSTIIYIDNSPCR